MMKPIDGLPDGVVGVRASGDVTGDDYESMLEPAIERALQTRPKIRFLYQLDREFTGFAPSAIWDDAKVGLRHWRDFERCAVVTDVRWVTDAVKLFRGLMPCPVRVFANDELGAATTWVSR